MVGDKVVETENKLIVRATEEMLDWEKLEPILNELEEAAINAERDKIRKLLKHLVPQYNPNQTSSIRGKYNG